MPFHSLSQVVVDLVRGWAIEQETHEKQNLGAELTDAASNVENMIAPIPSPNTPPASTCNPPPLERVQALRQLALALTIPPLHCPTTQIILETLAERLAPVEQILRDAGSAPLARTVAPAIAELADELAERHLRETIPRSARFGCPRCGRSWIRLEQDAWGVGPNEGDVQLACLFCGWTENGRPADSKTLLDRWSQTR